MKKRFDKKMIVTAVAISSLALLTGCGASPTNPAPSVPAAAGVAGVGGGCVPITTTSTISFTATNMYMGNPQLGDPRVLAGIIPGGDTLATGTYGTMIVTPGNVAAPVTTAYGQLGTYQGQRVDGTTISMTVSSALAPTTTAYPGGTGFGNTYSNWPVNGQVNATGYIQVSSFIQSLLYQTAVGGTAGSGFGSPILNTAPGAYPTAYPPVNAASICVSNVAISLQHGVGSYANWLYLGSIYFYLSGGVANGQHGLSLNF